MPFRPLDWAVIMVIALLVFGPKRLPELASSLGKTYQAFRKSLNEIQSPITQALMPQPVQPSETSAVAAVPAPEPTEDSKASEVSAETLEQHT